MTKTTAIITKVHDNPMALRYGYYYMVQITVNGYYSGSGRFCYTLEEAKKYASKNAANVVEIF